MMTEKLTAGSTHETQERTRGARTGVSGRSWGATRWAHRALSTRVLCGWYHAVARCTPVALPPRAEAMRVAAVTGVVRADAGRRRGSSSRCEEAVPPQSAPMNSSTRCHAFTCACAATTQRRALAAVSPMGEGQAGRQGGFRRVLPECVFSELGVVGVSHPAHG